MLECYNLLLMDYSHISLSVCRC